MEAIVAADPEARRDERARVLLLLFGVMLPAVALGVELYTNASHDIYFDPIPTWWHVVLVGAVPLASAHAIWLLRGHGDAAHALWSLRATAVAVLVCCFYTALYLPILPLSVLGILFFGFGVLPYAPLLAALVVWRARRRVARRFPDAVAPARARIAALAGLALLVLLETPGWITQAGFALAGSHDEATQQRGIALLRAAGSDASMRRILHHGRGRENLTGHLILGQGAVRGLAWSGSDRERDARTYYRATGRSPLDAERPSAPGSGRGIFTGFSDLDPGEADGMLLGSSRLDGSVHPEADLAYLEWTLQILNTRPFVQECRAQVLLPPGAAVTRATLWVNDEPRDAAFGPRGAVIAAYEKIAVQQRRDPLLVTSAGHDRVAIRCFPVPAEGEMKLRLGITAPLVLEADRGALRLPQLLDPNFANDHRTARTSVWIDSPVAFTHLPENLSTRPGERGGIVVRGHLGEDATTWLELPRAAGREVWAADAVSPNGFAIAQSVEPGASAVGRLAVVIDGSAPLAEHAGAIADALEGLPDAVELGVLVAGDAPLELLPPGDPREPALYLLRRFDFAGGQDAAPALEIAADRAAEVRRGAVLWIHAPLPIELGAPTSLRQRLERGRDATRWLDLQTHPGADALAAELADVVGFETVPRRGAFADDLAAALGRLSGRVPTFTTVRRRVKPPAGVAVAAPDTSRSAQLSRLWARDETLSLLRAGGTRARVEAAALASRYRVVTPVSGAVVLETDLQYTENELEAPEPGADDALAATDGVDFPAIGGPLNAIPEPGTGALTALGLTLLAAWRRRSRVRRRAPHEVRG